MPRRSNGQPRTVPLVYALDGKRMILVASNGGRSRDPAWCFNLCAHPTVRCTLKGQIGGFVATELDGDERDAAWRLALGVYPGYQRYQARTDRRIPLFRLEPL